MDKPLVTILSIAASDPTSGAGVQADLKAAAHCGVYAMTALTAVTSQNSKGICEVLQFHHKLFENSWNVSLMKSLPMP